MTGKPLKYCLYVREDLAALKDGFFETPELYGMRSDLYMYKDLRDFLLTENIELHTQGVLPPDQADVVLCVNETDFFKQYQRSARNRLVVLILTEPPVYNRNDWKEERHRLFDKVFTYNSDLAQKPGSRYVHLAYPIDLNIERPNRLPTREEFLQKRHSCMISAAFAITRSKANRGSLLYERYKVLSWYNRTAPGQLDYYARTLPEPKFLHFRGASLINKVSPALTKRLASYAYGRHLKGIYKGPVPGLDKNQTLARYKFNFCFENTAGLKGYITEKIFDCFFSNTVPVYYGAPDIEHYIPKNCFISFTDFPSVKALQKHLASMDYTEHAQYLANVDNFLNSPAAAAFSTRKFIETLYRETRP